MTTQREPVQRPREQLRNYLLWLEASGRVAYLPDPAQWVSSGQATQSQPSNAVPRPPSDSVAHVREPAGPLATSVKRPTTASTSVRSRVEDTSAAVHSPPPSPPPAALRQQAKTWTPQKKLEYLRDQVIGDCQRCPLSQRRTHLVFGEGNPNARVMVVGEAPGAQEDRLGRPFVGAAGQRLDQWIEQMGWKRKDLFIANVLKCRPPHNRDPSPLEIDACRGFLRAQVRAIAPAVIVALGRFAGALVLGRPGLKLYEMRGQNHVYEDPKLDGQRVEVVVTYHPSYVLRREKEQRDPVSPSQEESKVLADFVRARAVVTKTAPHGA